MLVFLSHAADDRELAAEVATHLGTRFPGLAIFSASQPGILTPGELWNSELQQALIQADVFVVLFTPASVARFWVGLESGFALARVLCAGAPAQVLPLTAAGLPISSLPAPFRERQAMSWDDPTQRGAFTTRIGELTAAPAQWKGIELDGAYYAWDGPSLCALTEAGMPRTVIPKLFEHLKSGAAALGFEVVYRDTGYDFQQLGIGDDQFLYLTDRRAWKQRMISLSNPFKSVCVRRLPPTRSS
jgi:TIR domain